MSWLVRRKIGNLGLFVASTAWLGVMAALAESPTTKGGSVGAPPGTRTAPSAATTRATPRSELPKGEAVRSEPAQGQPPAPESRLREGSIIVEELGEFQDTGDRIIFKPRDRNVSFPTLENLAVERIARVLEENPGRRLWSVTGTVTEFRGTNFLLVTKAVLKGKRPPDKTPTPPDKTPTPPDKTPTPPDKTPAPPDKTPAPPGH